MRTCKKCGVEKPESAFYRTSIVRKGVRHSYLRRDCKACFSRCISEWQNERLRLDPEYKVKRLESQLRSLAKRLGKTVV